MFFKKGVYPYDWMDDNEYCSLCMVNYGLDPFHFISAPSMSWRASLKITKVTLEFLTDVNI